MKSINPSATRTLRVIAGRRRIAVAAATLAGVGFLALLAWSGVTAFQRHTQPVALAAQRPAPAQPGRTLGERPAPAIQFDLPARDYEIVGQRTPTQTHRTAPTRPTTRRATPARATPTPAPPAPQNPDIKRDRSGKPIIVNGKPWTGEVFDHKPIRPVRTRTMKTTAYSPDARSCGKWADGITASGKSVWMNGGRLAAADRAVPYGTILTVPGYNDNKPVQVWDRGGAIKGNRLDLLYPTHEIAKQWGVQDLPVVFWEFVETDAR